MIEVKIDGVDQDLVEAERWRREYLLKKFGLKFDKRVVHFSWEYSNKLARENDAVIAARMKETTCNAK